MSDIENNQGISLAALAGLDVSEVSELRISKLPEGLYTFEGVKGELSERDTDDGKMFGAALGFKVIEVSAVMDKDTNPDTLIGKTHTEFRRIDPSKAEEGIGYLKGFVADLGIDLSLPENRSMGGVEGTDGYLNRINSDLRFVAKIKHRKGKDGVERANMELVGKK